MRTACCAFLGLLVFSDAAVAAPPVERRLHLGQVEASSYLINDWNRFQENYHPNYIADDDAKTAWVEGATTSGAGEWIRVKITRLDGTSKIRVRIRNGYQKSKALFAANARAKAITVKLLPSGATAKATLPDAMEWQEVAVEQKAGPVEAVEIKVDSVYAGTKYTDLCISDVQVFATSTTKQNPVFEKLKYVALQAWKQQRLEAARQFKKADAGTLPFLPAYEMKTTEGETDHDPIYACKGEDRCVLRETLAVAGRHAELKPWASAMALAAEALKADAVLVPGRVAPLDKRPLPPLDGFRPFNLQDVTDDMPWSGDILMPHYGTVGALRTDSLRPLDTKLPVTIEEALAAKPKVCHREKPTTFSWMLRQKVTEGADAGRDTVRVVLAVTCGRVGVRDGWTDIAAPQLLVYDEAGRLSLIAGYYYVSGLRWDKVDGHDVIVAAQGYVTDSGTTTVERRVAAAP